MAQSIGEQFEGGIMKARQYKDEAIEAGLRRFGNYIIECATTFVGYENQTYNLHDSYGYAVYHNEIIQGKPVMLRPVAYNPDTKGGWGKERGKDFLESFHPTHKGWSITIVAGEFYASFLENEKKLDVLTRAMFHSKDSFLQHFTKMS